jgi:hypothetical protein
VWLYVTCFQICIHCRSFLDLCIPQIGPEPSKTQQDDADRVMRELLQEEDKAAAPAAVVSQKPTAAGAAALFCEPTAAGAAALKTQQDDADRVMRELSIRHSNGPE